MANPNLHTDFTGLSVGIDVAVINIGLQSMKGNTAFLILFLAGEFCATETAGAIDFDTIGTIIHRKLNSTFHRTAETDTTFELLSDAFGHQLSIGLSAADLNDVHEHLFTGGQLGEGDAKCFEILTFFADQNTGASGVNSNTHSAGEAFDLNTCNSSGRTHLTDAGADLKILLQPVTEQSTSGVFLIGEPA